MSVSLFLPPTACAEVSAQLAVWRVDGERCETLGFADALPESGIWRLVLPVEAVTVCAVSLPTTRVRWLAKALPFAVEELLAEDVELFHLCLGGSLADGRHRVYAVRRDWLAAWLALCEDNPPQRIAVDADLLPENDCQLLCLEQRWLLGGALETRLALPPSEWAELAASCPEPRVAHVPVGQGTPEGFDEVQEHDSPLVWLATHQGGCNLAQGAFATQRSNGHWQRWRPLAAVLGVCLLLQWGFNLAQGWYLRKEGERYAQENHELYRQLFPQDSRLINLRAQFDQHLAESSGTGQSQLLELLVQAAPVLDPRASGVQIEQLDFSAPRGELAFSVLASDFTVLESVRGRLQESGLQVQMGSASRDDSGVSARLVIGGNG